jgi:hypothetical protein
VKPLTLLMVLALVGGCHSRFKKHAPTVGAVRVEAITMRGPNVNLGRSPVSGGGLIGAAAAAYDITQMVREGNIASHIAGKVDSAQVNAAFVQGFREGLGDGPPFGTTEGEGGLLQFELVDWGLEMYGFASPGVYNYEVIVRGFRPDGKKMYRTSFQCFADAGTAGWAERNPFIGQNDPNAIKNIPAEQIQGIFDATAYDCGKQFVAVVRRHAG